MTNVINLEQSQVDFDLMKIGEIFNYVNYDASRLICLLTCFFEPHYAYYCNGYGCEGCYWVDGL